MISIQIPDQLGVEHLWGLFWLLTLERVQAQRCTTLGQTTPTTPIKWCNGIQILLDLTNEICDITQLKLSLEEENVLTFYHNSIGRYSYLLVHITFY